jgi:hypothetical protein
MKLKIILIEDTLQSVQDLLPALTAELAANGEAKQFAPQKAAKSEGLYEERLEQDLRQPDYRDATLIVADRDLSKTEGYRGLSESMVKRVADALGVPECGYARGEKDEEFVRNAERREGRIAVSVREGPKRFAQQVISIASGFSSIAEKLPSAIRSPGRKSPARLLAEILGKPEYAEKISLYASGDQNRLASVLRLASNPPEQQRQLACLLGYWLWDSVLRYPGVAVNETAASSFLNIREDVFRAASDVQALFAKALYDGPFGAAKGLMWWRPLLEDIVADGRSTDGREFAESRLKRGIPQSRCCEDLSKPAGYYCMLTGRPVSLDNSQGSLSWFPRGADLARVSRSKYEELGPWLTA